MNDLTKSRRTRDVKPELKGTAVDKELDGIKTQMNRMFSKIAQISLPHSSSQSSNNEGDKGRHGN